MNTGQTPRIVFVDDEPHVLDGLRRSLRAHGGAWDMAFYVTPGDALAAQKAHPFDVAVVDMRMPVMSGLDLIRAMTAHHPATASIMLTGTADLETAIAAINEAKVFRFYTKPCPAAVLASGIAEALAHVEASTATSPASGFRAEMLSVATLNRLPTGVVVVEGDAHVVFMNSLGAEYLGKSGALSLGSNGVCRAARQAETVEMHRLIKEIIEAGDGASVRALAVTRDREDRPLSVVIAPLPTTAEAPPVAVLLISDPERQTMPTAETIGRLFDLTDAEARLTLALGEGRRIEDAAEKLGITLSSARTYLKRIFNKTGITRQAELVRLVLAAPTLLDLGQHGKAGVARD